MTTFTASDEMGNGFSPAIANTKLSRRGGRNAVNRDRLAGAHTSLLAAQETPSVPHRLTAETKWLAASLGSFTQSGIYLLAGPPGSRKSGLALQLALDLARSHQRSLFVLTEEPAARLKARALTMTSDWANGSASRAMGQIAVEQDLPDLAAFPDFVRREVVNPLGSHHGVGLLVLDSVQGFGLASGSAAKYRRLYEATRLCQVAGITT